MERKLLHTPEGVRDIYNGECTQKLYIQDKIHNILKLYGYTDIQTPVSYTHLTLPTKLEV